MDGCEAEASVPAAVDGDIVKEDSLQFLDGPVGEQEPGEEGVEEQDDGVGDAGCDAVIAFAAGAAHRAASRGSTAGRCEGCESADGRDREEGEG